MEFRQLGNSGLRVSAVGLGTNNFGFRMDEETSIKVVHQAIEEGINFLDTADSYGRGLSEDRIGKAIKGVRCEMIVATKVANPVGDGPNDRGNSRHHIMGQVEASLRYLQTDYIDLYQIHRVDPRTPIEETLRALDDLVHQGKVRYIGCSNFAAWQVCEAVWTSKSLNLAPFISVQPEYNMINREVETDLMPFCHAYGMGVLPYVPLASGFLTGKYRVGEPIPDGTRLSGNSRAQERALTARNFEILSKLEGFAREKGYPMVGLAINWLLADECVSSVIAGATNIEQVKANSKAADWRLSKGDKEEVDAILTSAA